MFYKPGETDHGLPYDPYKACVIPRPIGWISTVSPTSDGEEPIYNLAPFSQFNNLTFDPPYVMFAANQTLPPHIINPSTSNPPSQHPTSPPHSQPSHHHRKDTVQNAESTGYFCWQLATYSLRHAVNATAEALDYSIDEFSRAGLSKTWSTILPVKIPMVAASPVRFECAYHSTLRLPGNPPWGTVDVVIGRVLGVHIDDGVIKDGKIDVGTTQPIARLGYHDYAVVKESFEMVIPGSKKQGGGLEGSIKSNRALNRDAAESQVVRKQSQDQIVAENGDDGADEDTKTQL